MEVLLKKTKVTSTIMNQVLRGSNSLYLSNEAYSVLGWCIHKNEKKIVLQNQENSLLFLFYPENKSKVVSNNEQEPDGRGGWVFPLYWYLKGECRGNTLSYKFPTEELAKEARLRYDDFLKQVDSKGQFYL